MTTADISDSAGAQTIVAAVRKRWPWLKHLFADGAYDRTRLMDAAAIKTIDEPGAIEASTSASFSSKLHRRRLCAPENTVT